MLLKERVDCLVLDVQNVVAACLNRRTQELSEEQGSFSETLSLEVHEE